MTRINSAEQCDTRYRLGWFNAIKGDLPQSFLQAAIIRQS